MCLRFGFVYIWMCQIKNLRLMCRFTVAEGEQRKPKKVEGRCEFFCSGSRNEKKVKAFLLTVYVS